MRTTFQLAAATALALAVVAVPVAAVRAEEGEPRPKLLVLLVVDQLPRARLEASLPGGLGRLLREGRVFADATLAHGLTETCPGHAAISTGLNPGHAGIPANMVFEAGRPKYCAAHRSAALLRGSALADWIRAAGGKAVAISEKDRAALMLGGRTPGLAIWLDPGAGFTTAGRPSSQPAWLTRFDAAQGLAPYDASRLPAEWSHPADDPRALPDDTPSEDAGASRTSPHPVRGAHLGQTRDRILRTPFADALTLDLARAAVEAEELGRGKKTDLLAVSLSATDYMGHAYGPDSQEILAALHALDGQLGAFLAALEERVGRGALVVALTADHGVTQIPEIGEQLGTSECRVPGGRVSGDLVRGRIAALAREACGLAAEPEVTTDGDSAFALPAEVWKGCKVPRQDGAVAVAAGLAALPAVVKAWTAPDLAAPRCAGACALYRASFDAERSADWVVQLDPGCQWSSGDAGASHGTAYLPDRAVPIVFWGAGVAPGTVRGPAHTIDVAPTLAARAGVQPGGPVDGRVLPLR